MTDAAGSLEALYERSGVPLPVHRERIRAGRNSEVWRLFSENRQWILKSYFLGGGHQHDRLWTEFQFLTFLNDVGIGRVPKALGIDRDAGCAVYSFMEGARPGVISSDHIAQAVEFLGDLNGHRTSLGAQTLAEASDACFSLKDHVDLVERRLQRWIEAAPQPHVGVQHDAHIFMTKHVLPTWNAIKDAVRRRIPESVTAIPLSTRILSPSDFGFHNALDDGGRLSFLDFEYAGWDDPAKLICDFVCQPELPISPAQGRLFEAMLTRTLPEPAEIAHRVDVLLPLHRVKWICILLNEFGPVDRQRRLHAGVWEDDLLTKQLAKAKHYFVTHLGSLS